MKNTYVLWGRKPEEPEWMEDMIIETNDPVKLNDAKIEATKQGFVGLRVLTMEGFEKPDFAGTLNIGKGRK